jgi:transposase
MQEHEEVPVMAIVGAFDVHRAQLTYDYVITGTGEVLRGLIRPADRARLRAWLTRFQGETEIAFAVEACTGWRYVVDELRRAGCEVHLAEPADLSKDRGPKQRAKTDAGDARHLRELLQQERVPESWIPPAEVLEARALVRLYKDLADERVGWAERIRATLFHQGVPRLASVLNASGRALLPSVELSPAGRRAVEVGLRQIERLSAETKVLAEEVRQRAHELPGCRALVEAHYGVGPMLAFAIWAEMGDPRRFSSSSDAVRYAGLDITVYSSDGKRSRGHISRQGPRSCAGRYTRQRFTRAALPRLTTLTTRRRRRVIRTMRRSPSSRSRASWRAAVTTLCASWGRRPGR